MMKPTALVIAIDLILVNATMYVFCLLGWSEMSLPIWFLTNVFYAISVLTFRPMAHHNFVRTDMIFGRALRTALVFWALVVSYMLVDKNIAIEWEHLIAEAAISMAVLFFGRVGARGLLKALRRKGRNTRKVAFVGAGRNLAYLYKIMMGELGTGYRVIGYFNDTESRHLPKELTRLGEVKDAEEWLKSNHVDQVFCNLSSDRSEEIVRLISFCESHFVRFFSVPNVHNYVQRHMVVQQIDDMPVLTIREEPLARPWNRFMKRAFDLAVSGLFLALAFWWIYGIVALITKLTMPGPVFFRQKRNGIRGEEFVCLKFRSMKVNDDADTVQATKDDPRKTKWGDIMRKTSIDELPQFINVWRGEMSVVGPRPHMVKHTEEYSALIDKYMVRHWVKPGITGWAQVTGARGETQELWQMEDRIEKDVWYVENWSMGLDLRIMYLTVRNAIKGDSQAY